MALYFLALAFLPLAVDWNDGRPYEPVKIELFLLLTAIALAAMAVSIFLKSMSSRPPPPRGGGATRDHVRLNRLDLAVTAYFTALALGTLTSVYPRLSFLGSDERHFGLLFICGLYALYWLTRRFLTREIFALFLKLSAIVVAVVSVYALAQWFGVDRTDLLLVFKLYGYSGPKRVFSTLGHPNFLGLWLVMILPLLAWLFVTLKSKFRFVVLGSIVLGVIALVLTYSRAAWLALAVEVIAALMLRSGGAQRRKIVAGALFAVMLTIAISGTLRGRLISSVDFQNGSSLSHLEEWRYGASLLPRRLVTGFGPETYLWYSALRPKLAAEHNRDESKPDPSVADRLHNVELDMLWNGGVLALAALLAVLWCFGKRLRTSADRPLAVALGISMLGWFVALQFGFDFSQSAILWWFLLGAAASDAMV